MGGMKKGKGGMIGKMLNYCQTFTKYNSKETIQAVCAPAQFGVKVR